MTEQQLLDKLAKPWADFSASYAGLSKASFRRRLRLDTCGHSPQRSRAIRAWREERSA